MPVISSHVFAVHKGGCGKSTLVFHTASCYAAKHPEQTVYVFDCSHMGDLTQLFLGGMKDSRGEVAQDKVFTDPTKGITALVRAAAGTAAPASPTGDGGLAGMFKNLRVGGGAPAAPSVDISSFAVRVSDINPKVPSNLLLLVGGRNEPFSDGEVARAVVSLGHSLASTPGPVKAFFDTDGDLTFSPYTRLAVRLSKGMIVPLETGTLDFRRLESCLEELHDVHAATGGQAARMQLICWNKVDVQTYKPSAVSSSLTPPKAIIDKVDRLNRLLATTAINFPSIFAYPVPTEGDVGDFLNSCCMCMQAFGVTGDYGLEFGTPFVTMGTGKLSPEHTISADRLAKCRDNIEELVAHLEEELP